MSKEHILDFIRNNYTMVDLLDKIEPYIDMDDFLSLLQPLLEERFQEIFEDELDDYYNMCDEED